MPQRFFPAVLCCWIIFSATHAGEILSSYVDYDDSEYHLNIVMRINASHQQVWQRLTNYKNLKQLSDAIRESHILNVDNKTTRIKIIREGCILFFCRTLTQVQDARELVPYKQNQNYLMVSEVEGQSDFKTGYTLWQVEPELNTTRVTISARLKPGFWIPPLLGPWLFQGKLVKQATQLINNLETLAQHDLPSQ